MFLLENSAAGFKLSNLGLQIDCFANYPTDIGNIKKKYCKKIRQTFLLNIFDKNKSFKN